MKTILRASCIALAAAIAVPGAANAFCGFYVAKADTKLFNKASKVVLAWDAGKTVITMANDYEGDPREFAMVVPVPEVPKRDQIAVVEMKLIDQLDAFTAPRLVEYFDRDPCAPEPKYMMDRSMVPSSPAPAGRMQENARAKGVTIEATYTVGEYDIAILSATQSDGLVSFLKESGYKIPEGAEKVLGSYISQKMKFFVARVNLGEMKNSGSTYLRPLQVSFQSPRFMLPIRLGTVNAKGPQDLVIFALTRKGRVETANYRTVKLPSDINVPEFVQGDFANFYRSLFDQAVKREDQRAVFLEYAWNLGWCDPCAAEPPKVADLRTLGAQWLEPNPAPGRIGSIGPIPGFITRLHVRYDAKTFPEDLVLLETSDTSNFQGRYVMNHPWRGPANCDAGMRYKASLPLRFEREAQTLANLTGWSIDEVRKRMAMGK